MMDFSLDSAFYVFNLVAHWAYSRWDLISVDVLAAINTKQQQYYSEIQQMDTKALSMYKESSSAAIEFVTNYSVQSGNALVKDWFKFFGQLFVKYRDGYVVTPNVESQNCGCSPVSASYPQPWFDRIVKDTKDHYLYGTPETLKSGVKPKAKIFESKKKTDLKSMQ
jgi:hypothetical protein